MTALLSLVRAGVWGGAPRSSLVLAGPVGGRAALPAARLPPAARRERSGRAS